MLLPVYVFTVYDSDDSTPLFAVGTDPGHAKPYLKAPTAFAEQEIDFAKASASIGRVSVEVVDVPQTPGDQTTGYITGLLADSAGYSQLNGHRGVLTQDVGAGAEVVIDGVISSSVLLDNFSTFGFELRDIRERERKTKAFTQTTTPTILPRGVLDGYGVELTVFSLSAITPIPATVPLTGTYYAVDSNQGRFVPSDAGDSRLLVTPAAVDALNSIAEVDGSPDVFVFNRFKVLWRLTSVGGAWTEVTNIRHSGSAFAPVPYVSRGGKILTFYLNNWVDGSTLPADEDDIDFIVQYVGPVTEDWPLHLQGMTVGELLADLYDGTYSDEDPRIAYDATAVAALTTPVRAIIREPVDDLRAWTEKHAYPIAFAAPVLNADGEIAPITYLLPVSGVTLPDLDNTNCAPLGGGWSHGSSDAVNLVKVTYLRDYGVDESATAPGDRIISREVEIKRRIQASLDLIGEQPIEVKSDLLRAIGTRDGGPLFGDVTDEVGARVADQIRYMVTDRFALGGQYFALLGDRADADVEALIPGAWTTVSVSWMPDYILGTRGLSRLAQVVGRRNRSAAWTELTLVDAGSANAPLTAPTLGTVTSASTGVVTVPVTALGTGSEARVDYAVNATEPAATSSLWTFAGRRSSTGDITTPPFASGSKIWIRARGENVGRRPSAWTTAVSITVDTIPRVLSVTITVSSLGVPTVSWTVNPDCDAVQLAYEIADVGTEPSFGSTVDADASDLSYEFSTLRLAEGEVFSVQVEPYPTWTGAAVSGTPGPAVEARSGQIRVRKRTITRGPSAFGVPPSAGLRPSTTGVTETFPLDLGVPSGAQIVEIRTIARRVNSADSVGFDINGPPFTTGFPPLLAQFNLDTLSHSASSSFTTETYTPSTPTLVGTTSPYEVVASLYADSDEADAEVWRVEIDILETVGEE